MKRLTEKGVKITMKDLENKIEKAYHKGFNEGFMTRKQAFKTLVKRIKQEIDKCVYEMDHAKLPTKKQMMRSRK